MNNAETTARIEMLEAAVVELIKRLPGTDVSWQFFDALRGQADNVARMQVLNELCVRVHQKNVDRSSPDQEDMLRTRVGAFGSDAS